MLFLKAQRLPVACTFWTENGIAITVNGKRNRKMINVDCVWHESDDFDLDDKWFQKDCPTCYV